MSGLAVLVGPVFLVDGLLLSTDALQPLTWLACGWCLTRIAQTGDERWWLGFGLAAGIALISKFLIFFYLAGLAVGVLATPLRRSLSKPWLYIGALITLIFLAPSLYWQAENGWPFLELGKAAVEGKNLVLSPLGFLGQQALFVGPVSAPIWLAGLWWLAVRPPLPHLRVFPIAFVTTGVLVYTLHGKAYYLSPVYPILLVGGALAIESWLVRPAYRWVVAGAIAVAGAIGAPLALPILPPEDYRAYARSLGMSPGVAAMEKGVPSVLPQPLADMFGWRQMAEKVSARITLYRPTSALRRSSSAAITGRPPRSTSTVQRCADRRRLAATTTTTSGGRAALTDQSRSSSAAIPRSTRSIFGASSASVNSTTPTQCGPRPSYRYMSCATHAFRSLPLGLHSSTTTRVPPDPQWSKFALIRRRW